jgi:hypothetical protein
MKGVPTGYLPIYRELVTSGICEVAVSADSIDKHAIFRN